MMRKIKLLLLCATITMSMLAVTACGGNGNDNNSQAPYEDDATQNNGVNGTGGANGTNGTTGTENDLNNDMDTTPEDTTNNGTVGGDLEDAGRNLIDSVEDTGDAIRDGIDNLRNVDGADNNMNR